MPVERTIFEMIATHERVRGIQNNEHQGDDDFVDCLGEGLSPLTRKILMHPVTTIEELAAKAAFTLKECAPLVKESDDPTEMHCEDLGYWALAHDASALARQQPQQSKAA